MILEVGKKYTVTAKEIRPYGAIVEMEDGSTQLIHISNIANTFVNDVADYITVGQQYEVSAIQGKVKDVELTMKDPATIKYVNNRPKCEKSFEEMLEDYLPNETDRRHKRSGDRSYNRRKRY